MTINIKQKFIDELIVLIKHDDVKREIKELFKPIINIIMQNIYPYIYISIILVSISFFLILGIFILLLRNSYNLCNSCNS